MKLIVDIEKLDNFGRGIAYFNNKICFIKNSYPKEKVEIKITKEYKNYIEGEIVQIINKSPDRLDIESPFLYSGFPFMNYKREKEIEYKENLIRELFSKYTNNINSLIYSNNLDYRNKITIFKKDKNIGILKENSHEILNVDNLFFVNPRIKEEYLKIKHEDFIKLMIRTNGKDVIKMYDEKDNEEYLIDNLLGYKFKIRVKSFYQVNKNICEKLYLKVKEYLEKDDIVLDLYSGISTISICISDKVKEVLGVEINKSSYLDSIDNIKLNNITNVKSFNMDVINYLDKYKNFNTIIVDPPRKGLDKKLINYLNSDKLIYISCNPITLKRDLELLKDRYKVEEITPFDMFSRTAHVETLVLMKKI
jgi:23S rRNA (uracil-5-)-methyltransferase rumA